MTITLLLLPFFCFLLNVAGQCSDVAQETNTTNAAIFDPTNSIFVNNVLTIGYLWGITTTRDVVPTVQIGTCPAAVTVGATQTNPCFIGQTISHNFTDLTSNCGWALISSGSVLVYGGTMTLSANETYTDQRGNAQIRLLTYTLQLSVSFPDFATSNTSVEIFSSVLLDVFIGSQIYSTSTAKATVTFTTVVGFPFKIAIVNAGGVVSPSGTLVSFVSTTSLGLTQGSTSTQVWDLVITPNSTMCDYSGIYDLEPVFQIQCALPNVTDCPAINNNTVGIALTITSENFCASIASYVAVTATLKSYQDALQAVGTSNFLTNDFQTAYFEMVVTSSSVTITNLTIQTIFLYTAAGNFLLSGGTPANVVGLYANGAFASNANLNPVIGSGAGGRQKFQFDITSSLFAVTRDRSTTVVVEVNGTISYLGGKKRDVMALFAAGKDQSALISNNLVVGSNGGYKVGFSLFPAVILVLFFLF